MKTYAETIKEEVRKLRRRGLSLNELHGKLQIPKTTMRGWIKDIILTDLQKEKFRKRTLKGLQKGRVISQKKAKDKRARLVESLRMKGLKKFKKINNRELFIAGIALYWAEGFKNKHEHRLGFCNSDPSMMKFYIYWLQECLGVRREDLVARISLNKSYEGQINEIEQFWVDYLEISTEQFTKPFYQNSIWKKQFNTESYKGVLRIHVKNSLKQLLQMRGWIEGLKMVK